MTKDDIIKLAREAGFADGMAEIMGLYGFMKFANLVAAAEQEACAKVCETEADNPSCLWEEPGCWQHAAENCAVSIRARGNT